MLKNENEYIFRKNEVLRLNLEKTEKLFTFDKPLRIYKIKGSGEVLIYLDENMETLMYSGTLPFKLVTPIFTDKLYITAENIPMEILIISEFAIEKMKLEEHLNIFDDMVVVSPSYNDDGYFTVDIPFAFQFNKSAVDKVFISSNHYIGFGTNREDLKIFRRDGCSTKIYKKEGTFGDGTKFLKIRFEGYTYYNNRVDSNRLIFELFLIENNDMFLCLITTPLDLNTGVTELNHNGSTHHLVITEEAKNISFYYDENIDDFNLEYEMYKDNSIAADELYLVKMDDKFYSVVDDNLSELEITGISASDFIEYGCEKELLNTVLKDAINPTVYMFSSENEDINSKVHLNGLPHPKVLESTIHMNHESIIGIKMMSAQYKGDIGVCYSLDEGLSFTEITAMDEFLNLDVNLLYESLNENKILIIRFILNLDAAISRFKITYKN